MTSQSCANMAQMINSTVKDDCLLLCMHHCQSGFPGTCLCQLLDPSLILTMMPKQTNWSAMQGYMVVYNH